MKDNSDSSKSLRTLSNVYSNYYCGQSVMAQRYRMSDSSLTTYCPGIIKKVISSYYYEIEFNDGSTQILRKTYFYANNPKNREEQFNYNSKLYSLYGIGSKVTVNKNYYKNKSPDFQSAIITDGSYLEGEFTLQLEDDTTMKKVPLSEVYTECDSVTVPNEEDSANVCPKEDTIPEVSTDKCERVVKFSSHLFIMQNKQVFGILFIILSLITFLIIIRKMFIKNPIFNNDDQFLLVQNIFLTLISISSIFLVIILVNKKTINILNFGILISSIFLIWLFTIVFKHQKPTFLYRTFLKDSQELTSNEFGYQILWSLIFPISIGPFYLLAYLILFIPNLILGQFSKFSKFRFKFIDFFYGQIPGILGNNMALYLAVIFLFLFLYLYLVTYFFNGYVDVSNEITQNNLTSNPIVKIKQVGNDTLSLIKNYTVEVIYLSLIGCYFIIKYIVPEISFFQEPRILSIIQKLPDISSPMIIILAIIFLILLIFVKVSIPSIKMLFNPDVKIIKFDENSKTFLVGVVSGDEVVHTKNVSPEDLGKQIKTNKNINFEYNSDCNIFTITNTDNDEESDDTSDTTSYTSSETESTINTTADTTTADTTTADTTTTNMTSDTTTEESDSSTSKTSKQEIKIKLEDFNRYISSLENNLFKVKKFLTVDSDGFNITSNLQSANTKTILIVAITFFILIFIFVLMIFYFSRKYQGSKSIIGNIDDLVTETIDFSKKLND